MVQTVRCVRYFLLLLLAIGVSSLLSDLSVSSNKPFDSDGGMFRREKGQMGAQYEYVGERRAASDGDDGDVSMMVSGFPVFARTVRTCAVPAHAWPTDRPGFSIQHLALPS